MHATQEVLDELTGVLPGMGYVRRDEWQGYLVGAMASMAHRKIIDDFIVQLNQTGAHYDIAFKMNGDGQFYYTAVIV